MGSKKVRDNYLYEIISERLSVDDGMEESAMERGERLEQEAISEFEKSTGKIVDRVGFAESDESELVGFSPDGLIANKGFYTEAVEAKCLSSANYVRAWIENQIPEEHQAQVIQAFIVNEKLETLYFVLYDPRIPIHPLHIIPVTRKELGQSITDYKKQEMDFVEEINTKIEELIKV